MADFLPTDRTPQTAHEVDAIQAIRLEEAVLCVECDVVYHVTRHSCPACGGRVSHSIAAWLNRRRLRRAS